MASLRGRSWMQILGGVALVATTAGSVGAQQPTHPRTFEVLGVLGSELTALLTPMMQKMPMVMPNSERKERSLLAISCCQAWAAPS